MSRSSTATLAAVSGLALLTPWAAAAQCAATASSQDVLTSVEIAEATFSEVDLAGFEAATDEIRRLVPCLAEAVPRSAVAAVHRMQGLRAFVDRDPDRSTAAFAAARSVEPAYTFPELLVPSGHPVLRDYEAIPIDTVPTERVAYPAAGYLQFDGRTGQDRPTAWPTLVQLVGADGGVQQSAYLWPGDSMIAYEAGNPPTVAGPSTSGGTVAGPSRPFPISIPLVATAGVAAITSGILYAMASGSHDTYYDPQTPYQDLDELRVRTNALVVASGGVGIAALGAGVGAVVAGKW